MKEELDRYTLARCLEIIRNVRDEFLSDTYAENQPASSFAERFACGQVAERIENEFGLGTSEQCDLLGKPRPIEVYRASLPQEEHQ